MIHYSRIGRSGNVHTDMHGGKMMMSRKDGEV